MTDPVILVPLDGSQPALCALPGARSLAKLLKLPVRMLHVAAQVGLQAVTAERLGLAPAHLEGAPLETRAGDPAAAILSAADDCRARLIVMSAWTADARPAEVLGAVALAVLRRAPCPVVLVDPAKAPGDWAFRRLLVPHDGSPTVSDALRPAAELAREAGAELTVLQAAAAEPAGESGSIAPPLYADHLQYAWPAWSDEFLQRLACICPLKDMRARLRVERGEPADETIRVASEEGTDLIALAWKGGWEPSCAPIVKAVLRDAPCPVMVTRTPGD